MKDNILYTLYSAIRWMRRFSVSLIFLLLLFVPALHGCYEKSSDLPAGEHGRGDLVIQAGEHKTRVLDTQSKHRSPDHPKEYVMIGDQRYEVGSPWLGYRIGDDKDFGERKLVMLPREYGEGGREIYVTVETREAFVEMAEAAAEAGLSLKVDSGYRSSAYQEKIYKKKLSEGESFNDVARWVAPPGYSEHIFGTTLDLTPSNWTFSKTDAEKWLMANGEDYSFTQSYPRVTSKGFAWEPWHWKYDE